MTDRDADARQTDTEAAATEPGVADAGEGGPGPTDRHVVEERDSKAEVAAKERGERGYDETYGRPAGARFGSADYPHAYGSPGRMDWRRALRAYVNGHDRGWEADRKYAVAGAAGERAASPRGGAGSPGRPGAPGEESHGAGGAGAAEADEATARTARGTRFGVGVADPSEMTFHRSASTWRERLPEAPRLPRHAARGPAERRGRGEQA